MNGLRKTFAIAAAVSMVGLSSVGAMAAPGPKLIVKGPDGAASPTDKLVVTDTGFIGVGTSAPVTAIQVLGNSQASTQIKLMDNLNAAGTNAGGGLLFGHNNGTALPLQNDRLGYLNAGTTDDVDGVTPRYGGGLQLNAAANWSIDRVTAAPSLIYHFPTYLRFQTAGANAANVTGGGGGSLVRMLIYPEGNVYVGTVATPLTPPAVTQKLEVDGGVRLIPQAITCTASNVGTISYNPTNDTIQVCTPTGAKTVTPQ